MCGIAGIVYFDRDRKVKEHEIKKMTDIMYHRGPDDEGFYINNNVGLGFRRLSIIDLKTGHQPISNHDSSISIIFNGEIYNFKEQRNILRKKGYRFQTETDTEVILHLYEEYGPDCLDYLRGMFAFAIWDSNKQHLFCARDRFGIKPFYYYKDDEKFIFGSEMKSITTAEHIDKSISLSALDSYFAFGYITNDLSIYRNIKKLKPSNYIILSFSSEEKIEINRYYNFQFEPDFSKTEKQWEDEIENTLQETIQMHMISDVPLGAFLSGGIDSSSVVALMAKNSTQPIKTFSIGFKEQKFNELIFAQEIAAKYKCEHHFQIVEPESINLLPKIVKAYDEPFADSSAIPTYYVSKFAREFVKVALSGDGGDELFAGYDIYNYLHRIHKYSFPYPLFNNLFWSNIHKLIPQKISGKGLTYFLSKNKKYLGAYLTIWNKQERDNLLKDNYNDNSNGNASENYKMQILKRGQDNDFISNLQYLDLQTYLVDDILTKVDRASMLNSLEVRVPLLDHKFAELTFNIPWDLKLNGDERKYILKKSMAQSLSPEIINHKKQGFSIPMALWFKDDLKEFVKDTLLSDNPLYSTYLNKKQVYKTIENNQKGMRDFSSKIWSLLVFEEWLHQIKNN